MSLPVSNIRQLVSPTPMMIIRPDRVCLSVVSVEIGEDGWPREYDSSGSGQPILACCTHRVALLADREPWIRGLPCRMK